MRVGDHCRALRKHLVVASAGAALCFFGLFAASSSTETAVANGDTRTLHLYHTHTGETIDATFRVDGHYDPAVLKQLNHFLRDWRNNDETNMDPRLFDTLWEVYRTAGANEPIQIYSAYRSPETNAMLRRRSRAVAEHSQHMLGKAMDTTIPGFPMHLVREVGMKLQRGGVGWYPSANFVHLDVGGVRSWPRMSYDQLAGLFPDGKSVHVASNGQVLPGYEAARAEIAARGGTEIPPSQESQGFFAWLFGGGGNAGVAREDEEDRTAVAAAPQAVPAPQAPARPRDAVAYAGHDPASAGEDRAASEDRETQAPQPQNQQVASLEAKPAGDAETARSDAPTPMPPHRPTDLAAVAEIPLPPVRPAALQRTPTVVVKFAEAPHHDDRIAGLIATSAVSSAPLRRAPLPAMITQGDRASVPGVALAFAEPVVRDAAPASHAPSRTRSMSVPSVGLRAALRGSRKEGAPASQQLVTASAAPVGIAPRLTGLRRAAKLNSERASL